MQFNLLNILIVIISFCVMEGIAWLTHKYIMHGLLWKLHKDHHKKHEGILEKNDFFFVLFAIPGAAFLIYGIIDQYSFSFYVGLGITLYGLAYFLIHDIFIHQRIPFLKKTKNSYLLALRKAHKVHHKNTERLNGCCFGMLLVPAKYFNHKNKSVFTA